MLRPRSGEEFRRGLLLRAILLKARGMLDRAMECLITSCLGGGTSLVDACLSASRMSNNNPPFDHCRSARSAGSAAVLVNHAELRLLSEADRELELL